MWRTAVDRTRLDRRDRSGGGIGKLTGMKAVFSRAMDFDGGGYGNAVLTKLPVRSEER